MNTGFSESRQRIIVTLFTWMWLFGSLIFSTYFAFWLFPEVFNARTNPPVLVYFLTKEDNKILYRPNENSYRKRFFKNLSDNEFLYFTTCDLLPLSQRAKCDYLTNWKGIDLSKLNCTEVATCTTSQYTLSEDERNDKLSELYAKIGERISISDLPNPQLPLSDPMGWGKAARLPLFFICLFFLLKLGRVFGGFLFTSYNIVDPESQTGF